MVNFGSRKRLYQTIVSDLSLNQCVLVDHNVMKIRQRDRKSVV